MSLAIQESQRSKAEYAEIIEMYTLSAQMHPCKSEDTWPTKHLEDVFGWSGFGPLGCILVYHLAYTQFLK